MENTIKREDIEMDNYEGQLFHWENDCLLGIEELKASIQYHKAMSRVMQTRADVEQKQLDLAEKALKEYQDGKQSKEA